MLAKGRFKTVYDYEVILTGIINGSKLVLPEVRAVNFSSDVTKQAGI